MMKKKQNILYLVVSLVCLLLIIVFGKDIKSVYTLDKNYEQIVAPNPINNVGDNADSSVSVSINVETLEEAFKDKAFLSTAEYYATQLETYTKDKKIVFVTAESTFIYSYEVSVDAGIDCTKIKFDVDDENRIIKVKLPEPTIETPQINRESFKIYSEKESLWNPLKLKDYHNAETELENKTIENAKNNGILNRANERAEILVEGMIRSMPSTDSYKIEFVK